MENQCSSKLYSLSSSDPDSQDNHLVTTKMDVPGKVDLITTQKSCPSLTYFSQVLSFSMKWSSHFWWILTTTIIQPLPKSTLLWIKQPNKTFDWRFDLFTPRQCQFIFRRTSQVFKAIWLCILIQCSNCTSSWSEQCQQYNLHQSHSHAWNIEQDQWWSHCKKHQQDLKDVQLDYPASCY